MARDRRWAFVALAAAVAVAALAVVARSRPAEGAGGGGTQAGTTARFVLVAGPLGEKQTGVFVIDHETMRLLVYGVDVGKKQLKLVAVRDISQDVRLSHWNNAKPWPEEIRRYVESGVAPGGRKEEAQPGAPSQ